MTDCFSIVEQRDGLPPRVLVEVDGTGEAEALVKDLRQRHHRVHLVRGQARVPTTVQDRFNEPKF